MAHLLEIGVNVNGWYFNNDYERDRFYSPISEAALHGQKQAVEFLLEKGAGVNNSLLAAATHGYTTVAQVILDNCIQNPRMLNLSYAKSVELENDRLCSILLRHGARMEEETQP